MALDANRSVGPVDVALNQPPDAWGQGIGGATIEQSYYDHPYPKVSLLIDEVKQFSDSFGNVIKREEDHWEYDEITRAPLMHVLTVYAWTWLPGVTNEWSLQKVQEDRTVYTVEGWFLAGEASRRTTKAGWVVYDLRPAPQSLTSAQEDLLHSGGVVAPGEGDAKGAYANSDNENRLIPESGKRWDFAGNSASVVRKATAPQIAIWRDPVELEEIRVEEDFQRVITWTTRKNYLQPGPPTIERKESLKDPNAVTIPVDLQPPTLAANNAAAAGVNLLVKGGGVDVKGFDAWLFEHVQHIRPEKYIIYRKTTNQPGRTGSGNPYGLWATAPPATVGSGSPPPTIFSGTPGIILTLRPLELTAAKDTTGNPINPVPSQTPYVEPEDPTPPVADAWRQIAEVDNAEPDKNRPGHAQYSDTDVESGATYEYFAVAVLASATSPQSNHAQITYPGPLTYTSGMRVSVRQKKDGSLEIDVQGPEFVGVPNGFGDTRVIKAPVQFTDPPTGAGPGGGGGSGDEWSSGLITDPTTFGSEAGLRQMLKYGIQEQVSVALTTPFLPAERGQLVMIPAVVWQTYGRGMQLSSQTVASDFLLDGFSWTISRDKDEWKVDAGTLELKLP
jgi:hypothetical protein